MGVMEEVDFGGALVGGDGARPNLMCQRSGIGGNKQATIRTPQEPPASIGGFLWVSFGFYDF